MFGICVERHNKQSVILNLMQISAITSDGHDQTQCLMRDGTVYYLELPFEKVRDQLDRELGLVMLDGDV